MNSSIPRPCGSVFPASDASPPVRKRYALLHFPELPVAAPTQLLNGICFGYIPFCADPDTQDNTSTRRRKQVLYLSVDDLRTSSVADLHQMWTVGGGPHRT